MRFYKIMPASLSYRGSQSLIYRTEAKLVTGQLVTIPLRNQTCAGIVIKTANKPAFNAKPISDISKLPPLPSRLVILAEWMIGYYGCGTGSVARQLVSDNYLAAVKSPAPPADNEVAAADLPPLTIEQKSALAKVSTSGTYLLHGETGSGKTRVYIELAKKALSNNRSAIILTPEIGLTAQLAEQFKLVFNERVLVNHSQLTTSERRQVWQLMLASRKPVIVVGPRSALFSPLPDVGLIAIDESHDGSYKQNDSPHYSAGVVAAKLAEISNCPLLLGSATPSVSDYFMAESRRRPILRLTKPAVETSHTPLNLTLVDIKNRANFKRSQYLSNQLVEAGETALANGEQVLLFLNRRGTARVVLCANCGWSANCPNCGLPLTYHGDNHNLRCHSCSYHQTPPSRCLNCGSNDLDFRGIGTKAIETEAKKLFPKASVRRFDNDNLKSERLEQAYDQVKRGKIDIIIGTQTIAKGLDLPKLAVVGIVVADTSLYLPDFSADERTYQLIRQVIGRVGRGHRQGNAIIQTYNPASPLINEALSGDYLSFYKRELEARQKFRFPPTCHLLKLTIGRASSKRAEAAAEKLKKSLLESDTRLAIDGPSPCFHELRGGKYYWQLVAKSSTRASLLAILATMSADVTSELDPVSLL